MDLQQQERPPAYSHDPESLQLPSVPRQELSPPPPLTVNTLPNLRSLGLPESIHHREAADSTSSTKTNGWRSEAPISRASFPAVPVGSLRTGGGDGDIGSPIYSETIGSVEDNNRTPRAASVVSMDDPDVRLAAEALSGLGKSEFIRSPSASNRSLSLNPSLKGENGSEEAEPLLSLITSSHPWLGGTINGSLSAYSSTKYYSPRFVKYGAEFVERNIGSPVANTVSAVGKRTGVEGSIRRYLGNHRRPSDLEKSDDEDRENSHKRRRVMQSPQEMDIEKGLQSPRFDTRMRGSSQSSFAETLPAYDDHRSPSYEETMTGVETAEKPNGDRQKNWSTQLMITTSGLGVALSDRSLQSLKYCLHILRNATNNVDNAIRAIKLLLEDYEKVARSAEEDRAADPSSGEGAQLSRSTEKDEQCRRIAEALKAKGNEIMQTLKGVVAVVNKYTGPALPENAANVVRRQIMSIPQRWGAAVSRSSAAADSATAGTDERQGNTEVRGAHHMLAFAKESLDMIGQVSGVVHGTVVSAEAWLSRMGRRREEQMRSREGTAFADEKGLAGAVPAEEEQHRPDERRNNEKMAD